MKHTWKISITDEYDNIENEEQLWSIFLDYLKEVVRTEDLTCLSLKNSPERLTIKLLLR